MSLVPLLVNLAREFDTEYRAVDEFDRFLDDDFGFGINPVDIFRPRLMHHHHLPSTIARRSHAAPYLLSRRHRQRAGEKNEASSIIPTIGKDGFQVCMDVSQFKPSELTVKTVDNTVVVEGRHEEREDDHGLIQRHFIRKYTLPKDYDPNNVISTISSDGVLSVKAQPPKSITQNERVVQIVQTGPAHMNVKQPEGTTQATKQQTPHKQAQNGAETAK